MTLGRLFGFAVTVAVAEVGSHHASGTLPRGTITGYRLGLEGGRAGPARALKWHYQALEMLRSAVLGRWCQPVARYRASPGAAS